MGSIGQDTVAAMLRSDPVEGLKKGLRLAAWCAVALGAATAARADALDGILEVHSAYVNIDKGVFLLHARVEYPETPAIRNALQDGVTLTFDLEVRVDRDRRFWFNSNVVDLTLRRELTYHSIDLHPLKGSERNGAVMRAHPPRRPKLRPRRRDEKKRRLTAPVSKCPQKVE